MGKEEREEKGGGQGGGKKTPNILGGQAHRLITASFINKIHVFYISLRKTAFVGVSFWQGPFVTLARFVLAKRLEICSLFSGQMARYSLYPDGPKCLIPGRSQQGPNGFRGATPEPCLAVGGEGAAPPRAAPCRKVPLSRREGDGAGAAGFAARLSQVSCSVTQRNSLGKAAVRPRFQWGPGAGTVSGWALEKAKPSKPNPPSFHTDGL